MILDRLLSEMVVLIDIVVTDELVQSAASLALALMKKLPSVYVEDHLIRDLVTDVRVNLVSPEWTFGMLYCFLCTVQ